MSGFACMLCTGICTVCMQYCEYMGALMCLYGGALVCACIGALVCMHVGALVYV